MKNKFKLEIESILDNLGYPKIEANIQIPKKIEHGHLTTNVAMIIAKQTKTNPLEIAKKIIESLDKQKKYKKIELAGPGFINATINRVYYYI